MKKFTFYLMVLILSLNVFPNKLHASEKNPNATSTPPKEVSAEAKVMMDRLEEIKAMDKSSLKSSERKALRKEVRAINANLKTLGNGVYLSVGAIIIIILLLILLL